MREWIDVSWHRSEADAISHLGALLVEGIVTLQQRPRVRPISAWCYVVEFSP